MREARLKPEFADHYPGVPAGEWQSVGALLDRLVAQFLLARERSGAVLQGRLLDEEHFEFRGAADRPPDRPEGRTRRTDLS